MSKTRKPSDAAEAVFVRQGDYWTIAYQGQVTRLRDSKGLRQIAYLLANPNREFHALDLIELTDPQHEALRVDEREIAGLSIRASTQSDAGEALDAKARSAYRRRMAVLRNELDDAKEFGNAERAAELEDELEILARELAGSLGVGGRSRKPGSDAERARFRVTKNLKRSIEHIGAENEALGRLLETTIKSGTFCSYVPDTRFPVSWRLDKEPDASSETDSEAPSASGLIADSPASLRALAYRSSFVGRVSELGQLRLLLDRARSGRGALVLVGGAPGVGKTRIAAELAIEANAKRMSVLVGNCYEQETVPYLPFIEILEYLISHPANQDALRSMLGEQGPELSRLLPKLRRILPDLPTPLELPPEQARRHLVTAVCDFIARRAREHPMLLIFEDLHWADEPTLSMLRFLAQRLAELPILVVGTYRDLEEHLTPALAKSLEDQLRERSATWIRLKGLARGEVASMLESFSGQAVPAVIVDEIYRETGGNPFFVEELFRYLQEENRLYDSEGTFRSELKVGELEVPESIRLVVGRRLARLNSSTRDVLSTAAVMGRSVTFELLQAVTAAEPGSLVEELEEAEKAALISSSSDTQLQFFHELIRQAVLSNLSAPRRRRLHLQIAEAIERLHAGTLDDHVSELAHHYGRSSNFKKAVYYLHLAGAQAMQRSACDEAVNYLTVGRRLLSRLPGGAERDRTELDLEISLGRALESTKGWAATEVGQAFTRAVELSRRLTEASRASLAFSGLQTYYGVRGELLKARELASEFAAHAERTQQSELLRYADYAVAHILFWLGEFEGSLSHAEQAIAGYGPEQPEFRFAGVDVRVSGRLYAAWDLWHLGYPDRALATSRDAIAMAQRLSHPFSEAFALWYTACLCHFRREAESVRALIEKLIALSTEHGFQFLLVGGNVMQGWARAQERGDNEGIVQLCRSLEIFRASGAEVAVPWLLALRAEAHARAGNTEEALAALAEAFATVNRTAERHYEAELYRLKGELLLTQDGADPAVVANCFRTAIEIARQQRSRSLELRATTSLARLLAKQGKRAEARKALANVYGWFTEGFDTADLREARAVLDELSA